MPQECMRLRVLRTDSGLSTRSPVIGQKPPLARVAAMTLALSQVTSMEHSWEEETASGRAGRRQRISVNHYICGLQSNCGLNDSRCACYAGDVYYIAFASLKIHPEMLPG